MSKLHENPDTSLFVKKIKLIDSPCSFSFLKLNEVSIHSDDVTIGVFTDIYNRFDFRF